MPEETRWLSRTALDGILAQKAGLGWTSQKPVTAVCRRGRRASLAPCEGSRRPCWGLCVLPHRFSVSLSLFQNGKFIFEGLQAVSLGIPPNKAQAREKMLTSVVRREVQWPRHGPRGWLEPQGQAGAVLVGTQRSGSPRTHWRASHVTQLLWRTVCSSGKADLHLPVPLSAHSWCALVRHGGQAPANGGAPVPATCRRDTPSLVLSALEGEEGRAASKASPWRPAPPHDRRLSCGCLSVGSGRHVETGRQRKESAVCSPMGGLPRGLTWGHQETEGADVCCILTVRCVHGCVRQIS